MTDAKILLDELNCCFGQNSSQDCNTCLRKCDKDVWISLPLELVLDIKELLKEQDTVKQKMWNALYAEEDRLEKQYVGTDNHDDWFFVFRPWLQRGFELALKVLTN